MGPAIFRKVYRVYYPIFSGFRPIEFILYPDGTWNFRDTGSFTGIQAYLRRDHRLTLASQVLEHEKLSVQMMGRLVVPREILEFT